VLEASKEDTAKVNTLNTLARRMELAGNYGEGIRYARQAKDLSQQLNYPQGMAHACNNSGNIYYRQGSYPRALEDLFASLKIFEKLANKDWMAKLLGNIGNVYAEQKDYSSAIEYYSSALKIKEELGDKFEMAKTISNMGNIYTMQRNYTKALDHYFHALKLDKETGNKRGMAIRLGNIGTAYKEQAMTTPPGDLQDSLNKEALRYYFEALRINEAIGNKNGISIRLGNIGSLYVLEGKYEEGEEYLKKALALSLETGDKDGLKEWHSSLSTLYANTGRFREAYEQYRLSVIYSDSLLNEENTRKQTRTEMQYEFDKKEAITKAEQDKKDAVTRIVIWSVSGGLVLVLLLALFVFRGYREKQMANIIITRQKEEVENQKFLVELKQKEILDSIYYARRIQQSLLPTEKYLERNLDKYLKRK
jgi:tetratricopeptide (TPR) repeat protein